MAEDMQHQATDDATSAAPTGVPLWVSMAWLAVAVALVLTMAVMVTRTAGVRSRSVPLDVTSKVSAEQIIAQVTQASLGRHLDAMQAYPSRMPGTAGIDATAKYIEDTFTRLGMDVLKQPIELTVPVTEYCEILDADGNEIPGVKIYPFWPNLVRTCTIPEPGITGTAVMGAKGDAYFFHFSGLDPAKSIPVVRLSSMEQWIGLADAGFPAIIFFRDEATKPQHYRTKELDFPANFPRFMLEPGSDPALIRDKQIRIRCKVNWQTVQLPNIVGVFKPRGEQLAQEAVILTAHYDSISAVPDLAPGAEEASAVAALLSTAEFVAGQRENLSRSVIFIALVGRGQACRGVRQLADLWGQPGDEQAGQRRLAQRIEKLRHRQDLLDGELEVIADASFWAIDGNDDSQAQQELAYWQGRPEGLEEALLEDVRRVIERDIEQAQEVLIEADLARQRSSNVIESAEWNDYRTAREAVERLRIAATATLLSLKTYHGLTQDEARKAAIAQRLADKRKRLAAARGRAEQSAEVQKLLHSFDKHIVFCLALTTGAPSTGMHVDYPDSRRSVEGARGWVGPIASQIATDIRPLVPKLYGLDESDPMEVARARELFIDSVNSGKNFSPQVELDGGSMHYPYLYYYEYVQLLAGGRHAIGWTSPDDPARNIGTPEDTFDLLNKENLTKATRVIAAVAARMGTGRNQLNATPHLPRTKSARGHVVQAADPNSVIPTRGVEGALVVARHPSPFRLGSVRQEEIVISDEDGYFYFPPCDQLKPSQDFQAFRLDQNTGQILAVKDQGEKGELAFPTARQWNNFDNPLRLVLFRAAQTDLYYPLHPSTGVGLGSAFAVDRRTMAATQSFAMLSGNPFPPGVIGAWDSTVPGQGFSLFNPPATRFYIGLKSASPLDPSLEAVVAYLLGPETLPDLPPKDQEIWGPGYLAQDTPAIKLWIRQAAKSMKTLDNYRLQRQKKHRVADPILLQQQQLAADAVQLSDDLIADQKHPPALHAALDSLAISMEVYPRISQTERDAVIGVLFYLFLVIPFSIFVERLLFGFPDIRAQIGGIIGVFGIVFIMLRFLHPAFELVSSGLMVLLGFLTLSLSLFVTLYLFGKFQTNIKELRLKMQKTAEAADVSRVAAAGTAFLLGINNMRKRKVRTAFTCITLVLVTFALLSLTAVRKETRFKKIAVGQAPYTGLLIKGGGSQPLAGTSSLIERFGQNYAVSPLYWRYNSINSLSRGGMGLSLGDRNQAGSEKYPRFFLSNVVGLDPNEVNVTSVKDTLVAGRFFESDSEASVILSTTRAFQLNVTPEMAAAGKTTVYIDAQPLTLIGLFDAEKLERVQDLDGQSFLPYDGSVANRAGADQQSSNQAPPTQISIPQRVPRLPGHEIALVSALECGGFAYRVAVNMNKTQPRQAMETITDFIKRWEGFVYYGVGGISYYGRIYRGTQVQGFAEILVPLLIAAAIVLNTMLGSVYERTGEIGVYSAVGLSPSHVHYLFLAEACVYATIGAVAGYLLAHGIGAILGAIGLTSGLAFNYSTLSTVYATMAMITAVLVSTLYPARKAAKLAMPSEKAAIDVPRPDGDAMDVELPFTYVQLDAVSVIPFLYDVLEDHGEGSSAEFFCEEPKLVHEAAAGAGPASEGSDREDVYGLQARCWLKPYDLGVSQMMTLSIRPSQFSGVWSAHLHLDRLSGNPDSWWRANRLFVTVLRKHFLAWRGLEEPQKDEYLVRGLAIRGASIDQYLVGKQERR